jgi:hypothetical protein
MYLCERFKRIEKYIRRNFSQGISQSTIQSSLTPRLKNGSRSLCWIETEFVLV